MAYPVQYFRWFEFWGAPPTDVDFTFEYTIACSPSIRSDPVGSPIDPVADFTPAIWIGASASALPLSFYSDGPFSKKEITVPVSINTADLVDRRIDYLQLVYTIKAKVKDSVSSAYVDEIDNYTASFRLSPPDVQGQLVQDVRDLECLDPRYNWAIGNDKYWRYVVQSFVNPAGSTVLSLSDYLAGRSFENGDPIAVIPGAFLPSTTPALKPGKIYWVVAPVPKINGNIEIKDETGTKIMFNTQGVGNNYIKAVSDQYYLDGSNKKLKTARTYPSGTIVKLSGATAPVPDNNYSITSYDPKTRIIGGLPSLTPDGYKQCIRDVNDNSADSLNSVNYWTLSYLDGQTHDGDPYMCVENARLKSVAELGRLIYSYHPTDPAKIEPWTNLTFFGHNTNQLLDVFAVGDDNGVSDFVTTAKRGLLNPNVSNIDCLATVLSGTFVDDFNDTKIKNFYTRAGDTFTLQVQLPDYPLDRYYFSGMPIYLYGADALYYVLYLDYNRFKLAESYANAINGIAFNPPAGNGYLSPAKLTMPMAEIMARKMARGSCTNYSQLARTLSDFNFGSDDSKFPYPTTELEKESLLGHNIGLLSLRQNMFVIIIEAQVASGGNIPRNPVKQRVVVIVWRDPYTGEMFKRNITWLGD